MSKIGLNLDQNETLNLKMIFLVYDQIHDQIKNVIFLLDLR